MIVQRRRLAASAADGTDDPPFCKRQREREGIGSEVGDRNRVQSVPTVSGGREGSTAIAASRSSSWSAHVDRVANPQKIALPDVDAVVTEEVVGRHDVEVEVGK